MSEVWIAVDKTTNRIVAIGTQSEVASNAAFHTKISGNPTVNRKLRVGMILGDYM